VGLGFEETFVMSPRAFVLVALCLAICIHSLPVEPKFRQMTLQSQEAQTSVEIQAISSRIAFLQKLNKLTYDTTLFTRKLRWLLRRSLTEKPTVGEVAELMSKELEISRAQIEVAVEGVADELKLEVKQGIIALKAGLAFIEDNYKAGSDPEADAIIAKIKANLAALEARFGSKFGVTAEPPVVVESSTVEAEPPVASTVVVPPPVESSTVEVPPPTEVSSTAPAAGESSSTAGAVESTGSLIGEETVINTAETAGSQSSSTAAEEPPAAVSSTAPVPPTEVASSTASETPPSELPSTTESITLESSSTGFNSSSSSSDEFATQISTAPAAF
jgi:hypothetical protein